MWDKFKILNENDEKNGTTNLSMSNTMVEAKSCKQGGLVTMGVAGETLNDIVLSRRNVGVFLFVVDMDEYKKA